MNIETLDLLREALPYIQRFKGTTFVVKFSGKVTEDKPMLVVANKIDALDESERLARLRTHVESAHLPFHAVSAATGEGVPALLERVWRELAERTAAANAAPSGDPGLPGASGPGTA